MLQFFWNWVYILSHCTFSCSYIPIIVTTLVISIIKSWKAILPCFPPYLLTIALSTWRLRVYPTDLKTLLSSSTSIYPELLLSKCLKAFCLKKNVSFQHYMLFIRSENIQTQWSSIYSFGFQFVAQKGLPVCPSIWSMHLLLGNRNLSQDFFLFPSL